MVSPCRKGFLRGHPCPRLIVQRASGSRNRRFAALLDFQLARHPEGGVVTDGAHELVLARFDLDGPGARLATGEGWRAADVLPAVEDAQIVRERALVVEIDCEPAAAREHDRLRVERVLL